MSDPPDSTERDFLRENFARVSGKLDQISSDLGNLKVRVSALEVEVAHIRLGLERITSGGT
jgi:hypothetical protein